MVLVNNEWQNKSEDVPNTTANTTATAGTTITATAPTSSSAAIAEDSITDPSGSIQERGTENNGKHSQYKSKAVAEDIINSITDTASIISTATITELPESATVLTETLANDNINNEQTNEIIKDKNSIAIVYKRDLYDDHNINDVKNTEVEKLFTSSKQLKEEGSLQESVLNYTNSIKIMAENTKESPLKEEKEDEDTQRQSFINNHYAGSNKDIDESNSYLSSNDNTLTTPSITVKTQQNNQQQNILTQQQQQLSLNCPMTPDALSSALQSALNATNKANNTNTSVAAAGLQPNFLSQLALTANVAGLQKSTTAATILTAKQLNQSFNIVDSNNQNKSDSNILEGTTSVPAVTYDNNGQAKIVLICEGNSHPFQTRTISLTPNVECMVGRLIAKSKASENNAIFDCKVLSRKHAVMWYTPDGKFYVKDTKSSNGTFINDNKLGDEEAELHFGDIVKFGVDVLENSRKEVHGCIIACVKLYLPDGREAISYDSSAHRSQYSGEGRISYDELHRLNLYIQESAQREKVLTSKLCNIQNVLDATRKNSALCWQSMITEDQLLHRIHSLEKKLQFMEKNVPENILRNEVLKLLDDKSSYEHTAKEALRKVYQERCDAMQMLAKMESAYTQSDNECSVLRDQIMNSKQTLQDVNTRLLRLETEYNEYKDEVERQQQEAKDREELRITELTEKLRERELECEDLKKKISELLIKRAELLENEEQLLEKRAAEILENEELLLEKQAIEKLDAVVADMDLDDDEDSSDEYENDEVDVKKNYSKEEDEAKEEDIFVGQEKEAKFAIIRKKQATRPQLASIFGDKLNGVDDKQKQEDTSKLKKVKALDTSTHTSPPKRVKETTIMKWLQNSDLNKNEGYFDIFKAICNENENDDEDSGAPQAKDTKTIHLQNSLLVGESNLFCNFTSKLKNVQKNLKELEAEIENETKKEIYIKDEAQVEEKYENVDDSSDEEEADIKEGACADEEFIIKSNGQKCTPSGNVVLSKENKKYILLKSSVNMLREAYNEICDSVRDCEETQFHEGSEQCDENKRSISPNIKVTKQFQTFNTSLAMQSNQPDKKTILPSSESDNTESDSEVESLTLSSPVNSSVSMTVIDATNHTTSNRQLLEHLKEYQSQVSALNKKLQQTELEAQHTLEIMQVECDDVKLKMSNLNKTIEVLKSDKKCLEQAIHDKQNNAAVIETTSPISTTEVYKRNDAQLDKELELEEDSVLNAINATALEREEELITYKERLDKKERENIDLRNEIASLILKSNDRTTKDLMLKKYLPCGVIILAIIIYFITNYY